METPLTDRSETITGEPHHETRLNSSEIGNLWNGYMSFDMVSRFVEYLSQHVEDSDINLIISKAANIYGQRVRAIKTILEQEGIPVPVGFTEEDINLGAPRLYTDLFCLYYTFCLERFVVSRNAFMLGLSTRYDVREFFNSTIVSSLEFFEAVTRALLSKGLYIRYPYITLSGETDFVKKQDFLTGFLGKRRPSLAQEIAASFHMVFLNSVGKKLLTGFRQTAKSKQVRDYIDRGINLSDRIIDTFSSHLKAEDVPVPMFWDTMVTDSTEPTLSDKLMMFHIGLVGACGAMEYAILMTNNFRHDLKAKYMGIMIEAGDFGEDGINIMIDNGWFEEPPQLVARRDLMNEVRH